jgi:hypothetical protein
MFSDNEEIEYYIQEVNLPGLSIEHSKPLKGRYAAQIQGGVINYEDLSIKMLIDENFSIWKQIVKKIQFYRDDSNNGELQTDNKNSTLIVMSPDSEDVIMRVVLYGCKIKSIESVSFSSTENDDQLSVGITISFDYLEIQE